MNQFEKGIEIIKNLFDNLMTLSKNGIDGREVTHPDGFKTRMGLSYLLQAMGLSIDDNHKIWGQLTVYIKKPQEACEGFGHYLRQRSVNIFTWIKILESAAIDDEKSLLVAIENDIRHFMRLFNIQIPSATGVHMFNPYVISQYI